MPGGAPKGNTNGKRGAKWRNAPERALCRYQDGSVEQGQALNALATRLVQWALDGDKDAWQEIANRLDGKSPRLSICGTRQPYRLSST